MKAHTLLVLLFACFIVLGYAEQVDINGVVHGNDQRITRTMEELIEPSPFENGTIIHSPQSEYVDVWFGSLPDEVTRVPVDEYDEYIKKHGGSPEPLPDEGSYEAPPSQILWADDVLIDGPTTSWYSPSVAVADNGDIYAACEQTLQGRRGLRIYRSTNGGMTWSEWGSLSSTTADRRRPHILINENGTADYLYMAYDIESNTGEYNVWTLRSPLAAANFTYAAIDNSSNTTDTRPAIDEDLYASGYYVYAVYQRDAGSYLGNIRFSRTTDYAASWEASYSIAQTNAGYYRDPEIGYGYGGNLYVTWWFDADPGLDDAIRLRRAQNRVASSGDWGSVMLLTPNNDGIDDREPSVAATLNGNSVEVLYRRDMGSSWDIFEQYTTDGSSYTERRFAYGGSDNRTRWPRLCVDHSTERRFHLIWRVTYNHPPDPERIGYTYTETPGTWQSSITISDIGNEPSYAYPMAITPHYVYDANLNPWVVWLKYDGAYSLYYDASGFTGVTEDSHKGTAGFVTLAPNPFKDICMLNLNLTNAGNVLVKLFDASGRTVKTIVNGFKPTGTHAVNIDGTGLASGIYFIQIETPDFTTTKTVTIVH